MCNSRNPRKCIMPPYLSDKLDDVLGKKDDSGPGADERFREKRKKIAAIPESKSRGLSSTASKDRTKLCREIWDSHETPAEQGERIWKEGQPIPENDREVKNAIEGVGHVWNFYKTLFNRLSIDNKGLPIIQSVRYREEEDEEYCNAFWDGEQMFYGSGGKRFTNSFTSDLDIIAHELTHGVIDCEAKLEYKFQSGALNESFADVFGILIKQWANKTSVRKSDWLIGKKVLIGINALRSMKAPGTAFKNDPVFGDDPQPAHMKQFKKMRNTENGDYGGVHINSGITNLAFYITSFELGGNAWEKAGAIWYAALTDHKLMKKNSDFADAAVATIKKATLLFGNGSLAVKAVEKGWKEVGVI